MTNQNNPNVDSVKFTYVLPQAMTKAEEIQALRDFAAKFNAADHYLGTLFSSEMVDWVASKIQDDINPDLYMEWQFALGEVTREAEWKDRYLGIFKVEQAKVAKLEETVKALKERQAHLESALDDAEMDAREHAAIAEQHQARFEELENEILTLKGRLYDAGISSRD